MFFRLIISLFAFFGLGLVPLCAQEVVLREEEELVLGPKVSYLLLPEKKKYTLEEITQDSLQQRFQQSTQEHLNFSYQDGEVWLKFSVKHQAGEKLRYLLADAPMADGLDFYWKKAEETQWQSLKTGREKPFSSRGKQDHVGYILPLDFSETARIDLYIRAHSASPLILPLYVQTNAKLDNHTRQQHIYYGFYFGALAIMLLYNLFIFLSLRDLNYLVYSLAILSTLVVFSSVSGYSFKYVFPNFPALNVYIIKGFMGLLVLFMTWFSRSFLEIKKINIWLDRWFMVLMALGGMGFLSAVTGLSYNFPNRVVSLFSLSVCVVAIWALRKKVVAARFYALAWFSYIAGGVAITLRNSGSLPMNTFTTHAAEVGSMIEIVLLSLALAERYRQYRKEKEAATELALKIQEEANENLEVKVKERTEELQQANVNVNQINEELYSTLETVQKQSESLAHMHGEIQSSINYAKRIQQAMLPRAEEFKRFFEEYFILFQPRDTVSGDFYFLVEEEGRVFLGAVDCTGHGVPGGFVSMVGMHLLQEIILERHEKDPAKILDILHYAVQRSLHQKESGNQDGMDAALVCISPAEKKMEFAGARNPLLGLQGEKVIHIPGERQSIGGQQDLRPFVTHTLMLDGNGRFFLYSDGFQDQFGGKENRKYMSQHFRQRLIDAAHLPMEDIQQNLQTELEEWMQRGKEAQIDDILVLGFRA